jgi:DNA polymerase-3 subunit delta
LLRVYYGSDSYSRAQAVAELKQQLDSDGMLQANTVQFDGGHLDVPAVVAACETMPFLAANRLVIITDLLTQARPTRARTGRRSARESRAPSEIDQVLESVQRMPASTTLLMLEGELRGNATLETLRPYADLREFPLLSEQQLLGWVRSRAGELGTTFEPRAAALLVASIRGSDLWTLAAEVEKLTLFALGRAVTEADVQQLVPATHESNVFGMVDAVVTGKLDRALQQVRLLQRDGAAAPYLITMIARQYRQLIIAEDLAAAGASMSAIAKETGIRSEAVIPRIIQQARRMGPAQLQRAFERILEADLSIKRGAVDEDVAVELLITDLARQDVHSDGQMIATRLARR